MFTFLFIYVCFPLHSLWLPLLFSFPSWMTFYLLLCFLCLAFVPLYSSFAQLFFRAGVFVCTHTCSSTCEAFRGECEWHAADTQQESILPTSYRPLSRTRRQDKTRQGKRGGEIICLSVRLPVWRWETEIVIITWCAAGNHWGVCAWVLVCVCVFDKPTSLQKASDHNISHKKRMNGNQSSDMMIQAGTDTRLKCIAFKYS